MFEIRVQFSVQRFALQPIFTTALRVPGSPLNMPQEIFLRFGKNTDKRITMRSIICLVIFEFYLLHDINQN